MQHASISIEIIQKGNCVSIIEIMFCQKHSDRQVEIDGVNHWQLCCTLCATIDHS